MVIVLDVHKTNCEDGPAAVSSSEGVSSLREETRRTGRYVAAGTAIFLSLLGVYQALIQGTPEYAALFAPAVIMFVYVLWILHASRNQNARLRKASNREGEAGTTTGASVAAGDEASEEANDGGGSPPSTAVVSVASPSPPPPQEVPKNNSKQLNRSYSIA